MTRTMPRIALSLAFALLPACFDLETDDSGIDNACAIGGFPVDEVCNALDDDCDGQTDEAGVCAAQVLEQVRRIAPDARMVLDPSRIGPMTIARPSGGALFWCSGPAALPELDCVERYVESVAPAYGADGDLARLVLRNVRVTDGSVTYFYAQEGRVGEAVDPAETPGEEATYAPVMGAWLAVDVDRRGDPEEPNNAAIRGIRAFILAAPTDTRPADDFDPAWLTSRGIPFNPGNGRDVARLRYYVPGGGPAEEQEPVLVYAARVTKPDGPHTVVLAAREGHEVLVDSAMRTGRSVTVASGQASTNASTAQDAVNGWLDDASALCRTSGECDIRDAHAPGQPHSEAFEIVIHTYDEATEEERVCGACPALEEWPGGYAGYYDANENVSDIYLACSLCAFVQGIENTAVHESGHRVARSYWDPDLNCFPETADSLDEQCHAVLEFFSQQAEPLARACSDGTCPENDWSTYFAGDPSSDDYVMANFDAQYAKEDGLYHAATILGHALWTFRERMDTELGSREAAHDLVHLLYWKALPKLPVTADEGGRLRFADIWHAYRDACTVLADRGATYTGPNCDGDCTFSVTAATCSFLHAEFRAAGIASDELPAGVEVCNGTDDDGDGYVDNVEGGSTPLGIPCYTGPEGTEGVGTCAAGQRYCREGVWGEVCEDEILPELGE